MAQNDIILRNLEASVFYQIEQQPPSSASPDAPFYRSCALATQYLTDYTAGKDKDKVSLAVPTGYSVTMNPVEYWNGTSFPPAGSPCQANSPQLISLTVLNPNDSTASTQFVVDAVGAGQTSAAPTITGVSPSSAGQGTLGQIITVTGTGFVSGAKITFPGSTIIVNSTTFITSTTLSVSADILTAAGSYPVKVVNPDLQSSTYSSFTVKASSPSLHVSSMLPIPIGLPNLWFAIVVITVENGNGSPMRGVQVTGTWTPSPQPYSTSSCTTDQNGTCWVVDGFLFSSLSSSSVSFQVTPGNGLSLTGYTYDSSPDNPTGGLQIVNQP